MAVSMMPDINPAEKEIKYEANLFKYISFFKQDELDKVAEKNNVAIDASKLENKGVLSVVTFGNKVVPQADLQNIRHFFASVKKDIQTKTINKVTEKELSQYWNEIKKIGQKFKVLVEHENRKLQLIGESQPTLSAKTDIEYLLQHGVIRPGSAARPKRKVTSASGSRGNSGKPQFVLGYPNKDLDIDIQRESGYRDKDLKPLNIGGAAAVGQNRSGKAHWVRDSPPRDWETLNIGGATAMGQRSPRQPPAGGYTHVRSGVHVMATVTDITQMTVDAVVNAANHKLRHGGGVALAIARAAGRDLLRESNAYIRKNGHLDVSETFVSTAGKMSAKKVIHTVGPQWGHNDAQISMQLLHATFYNVLQTAERDKLPTLAIPGISSGTYGMPLDLVAEIAVNSITQYLENTQKTQNTVLTNIFLVGMDSSLISYIESHLDSYVQSGVYHSHSRPAPSGAVSNSPPVFPSRYQSPPSTHTEVFNLKDDMKDSRMNGRSSPQLNATAQAMPQQYGSQVGALSNCGLQNDDDDDDDEDDCCICMCPPINPKTLPKCKHTFCTDCIDRGFKIKPACPVCGEIYGEITGDQPKDGRMDVTRDRQQKLPGYERCGAIIIQYYFPGGIQTKDMASPGQSYSGTHRTAFLPDNAEGNKVLKLLERAFKARLIFTVGRSRTTGADNTVTWNDIHHKTNTHGGTQRFGYPDPTYLDRVQDELAAKGIK